MSLKELFEKLFIKKHNKKTNKKPNYPYYICHELPSDWFAECHVAGTAANNLFNFIITVKDSKGKDVVNSNLSDYAETSIRNHLKTVYENPDEYISYTEYKREYINWFLEDSSSGNIPFEVVKGLYPWLEQQLEFANKTINNNGVISNVTNEKYRQNNQYKETINIGCELSIDDMAVFKIENEVVNSEFKERTDKT